jgi:gamma-butyrobetaine dioxygenase
LSELVDGFRVATALRDEHPRHYATLTTVPWTWANRSKTSDYRWTSPLIVLRDGELFETRLGNWLRGPLVDAPFDQVEAAYAAYRALSELAVQDRFALRYPFTPGDLIAFDNRRVYHGRTAFADGTAGRRHLRGCYTERDELYSRLRLLARARRQRAAGA